MQKLIIYNIITTLNRKYGSVSKWSRQIRTACLECPLPNACQQYIRKCIEVVKAIRTACLECPLPNACHQNHTEVYRSGHNGPHSKCGNGVTRSWVRIPPLPPSCTQLNPTKVRLGAFFYNYGFKSHYVTEWDSNPQTHFFVILRVLISLHG